MELRPTRAADLPSLSRLFDARFGHPLTAEEWTWKYQQLPGEGRSVVAVDGAGVVVAHAGALSLPARWGGGTAAIWQLTDFVGTPRSRGLRPPLVELGRLLLDDLPRAGEAPWIYGFPSERHFRLGQRVFGYVPLTRIQEWSGEVGAVPRGQQAAVELSVSDSTTVGVPELGGIGESCGVLRTREFLNWRYWARPARYYRFYRAELPSGEALLVFSFVGTEARAAEVWLPRGEGTEALLSAVACDLSESGISSWSFWESPNLTAVDLTRLGLAPHVDVFVGVRGRRDLPPPLAEARAFCYRMGDYDLT